MYYRVSMRSVSLCQLYVCPQNHLSTFPVAEGHSVNFHASAGQFVYFQCVRRAFRQLPSALCASTESSLNFNQHSMCLRDRPSTFRMLGDVPSTSVNFLCVRGTIHQIFVCQCEHSVILSKHSVRLPNLPSTSVNFPCIHATFCQLVSTFCASAGHSVNFPFVHGTFRELFLW